MRLNIDKEPYSLHVPHYKQLTGVNAIPPRLEVLL